MATPGNDASVAFKGVTHPPVGLIPRCAWRPDKPKQKQIQDYTSGRSADPASAAKNGAARSARAGGAAQSVLAAEHRDPGEPRDWSGPEPLPERRRRPPRPPFPARPLDAAGPTPTAPWPRRLVSFVRSRSCRSAAPAFDQPAGHASQRPFPIHECLVSASAAPFSRPAALPRCRRRFRLSFSGSDFRPLRLPRDSRLDPALDRLPEQPERVAPFFAPFRGVDDLVAFTNQDDRRRPRARDDGVGDDLAPEVVADSPFTIFDLRRPFGTLKPAIRFGSFAFAITLPRATIAAP